MNMIKKLVLAALLVPSSMVFSCETPVQPESIMGNLYASGPGFKEALCKTGVGYYRLALDGSRLTLSASQGAEAAGNFFAEHYWTLGAATAAVLAGVGYLYFKRPSRPSWMTMQPYYQMWHNGRQWFSPVQPGQ